MDGVATYPRSETVSGDNVKIVSMLYDGALNFIGKARHKMETGDSLGKSNFIKKSSAIVYELSNSVNMEGGEIAANLKSLYEFVLESLISADVNNDIDALNNAERVVDILRGAWEDMQNAESM